MFSSRFMFQSAKIKLTVWYAIIIMIISAIFSLILYRVVTNDVKRRFDSIENRILVGTRLPRDHALHTFFEEGYSEAKKTVAVQLLYVNGFIVFLASAAGYMLARKTLDPLENAHEEQKRFVADASHELKTPLTALRTSIEVALRDKKMTLKEAKTVLKDNLEDIENLQTLSTDLLSLARFDKLQDKTVFETHDIKPIIQSAVKSLAPLIKKKNIALDKKLHSYDIFADKEQMTKVVTILLDNAIKYTLPKGKISIRTIKKGKNVKVIIKDTGVGIAKEDIPHIFDRFYRADQSRTKSKIDGYGLGLCLAKQIIDSHEGNIKIESVLKKGTTVKFTVPLS